MTRTSNWATAIYKLKTLHCIAIIVLFVACIRIKMPSCSSYLWILIQNWIINDFNNIRMCHRRWSIERVKLDPNGKSFVSSDVLRKSKHTKIIEWKSFMLSWRTKPSINKGIRKNRVFNSNIKCAREVHNTEHHHHQMYSECEVLNMPI